MTVWGRRSSPTLGLVGNPYPVPSKFLRPLDGKKPLMGHPQVTSLPYGLHVRLGDWPAGSVLDFHAGPHLGLEVGASLCPCCKWCMSSPGLPPSCLPRISLWYLLPRKKGKRWRTMLGQMLLNAGTGCWGYKRREEEHGETYHIPCGLWEKFKFISAPSTTCPNPDVPLPFYPSAFSHFMCFHILFIGSYP